MYITYSSTEGGKGALFPDSYHSLHWWNLNITSYLSQIGADFLFKSQLNTQPNAHTVAINSYNDNINATQGNSRNKKHKNYHMS